MSVFVKNKETSQGTAHNALAVGSFVRGNISAEEDFRIDGKVEGNIDCAGKVVIGLRAEIVGDICCTNLDIVGVVKGNLTVKELLSIKSSGNLVGDAMIGRLDIEAGAFFNGNCKMQ